ncbi:MAG: hypothetical protein NZ455_06190 [Bacteroidia bacterium]|nr:hypothetical protein [Bacteroidia bacterium]MDW8345762.1 hypothetical protein [Bacteroidia bacterium]
MREGYEAWRKTVRSISVAPSISVVRSSPTRAQRGTRPEIKLSFRIKYI